MFALLPVLFPSHFLIGLGAGTNLQPPSERFPSCAANRKTREAAAQKAFQSGVTPRGDALRDNNADADAGEKRRGRGTLRRGPDGVGRWRANVLRVQTPTGATP